MNNLATPKSRPKFRTSHIFTAPALNQITHFANRIQTVLRIENVSENKDLVQSVSKAK